MAASIEDDNYFHSEMPSSKCALSHNNELTNNDCAMQEMSFGADNISTYHGAVACHQDFSLQENNHACLQ